MEQESPAKLSRSSSAPARPPPAIASEFSWSATRPPPSIPTEPSSSITRPYRLSPSTSKGFAPSAPKPSALLQRRANAKQGLSEVKASLTDSDPSPSSAPSSKPPSAYEVLQISPSASQQEIKTSYGRLARQHHPDKVPPDRKEASSLLFLQIHAAYLALKDPEARACYDLQMSTQSSQSLLADLKTPRFCSPSPNIFTPRSQVYTPKGATAMPDPYTPRSQFYMPKGASAASATPKGATAGTASPNVVTPRTPFSAGRSWETDQCW